AFPQRWNYVPAVNRLFDGPKLWPGLVYGRNQDVGREALIRGGVEQKPDKAIQIQVIGRHRRDHKPGGAGLTLRIRQRDGARMACRAIEPDNFDTAINAPRDPDRQISRSIIGVVLV